MAQQNEIYYEATLKSNWSGIPKHTRIYFESESEIQKVLNADSVWVSYYSTPNFCKVVPSILTENRDDATLYELGFYKVTTIKRYEVQIIEGPVVNFEK